MKLEKLCGYSNLVQRHSCWWTHAPLVLLHSNYSMFSCTQMQTGGLLGKWTQCGLQVVI